MTSNTIAAEALPTEEVLTEERDGVLVITINRPAARNAIDGAVAHGLTEAIERLNRDDDLRVGVLTGSGGAFCSGMDLKAFAKSGMPKGIADFMRNGSGEKPVIAAIEGYALAGGLELALNCDIIVAAKQARLGIPEAKVGLFAAGGGVLRLPKRIPVNIAMEMAITAEPLSAERAYEVGLVSHLVEPGETLAAAVTIAERVARCAPLSVRASRTLIRHVDQGNDDELWELQAPLVKSVFRSQDAVEGPAAFAEKRPPKWSGA